MLGFYGDDFAGSVEALESLTLAGVRTALFFRPPGPGDLAKYSGLQAFGIAGRTRTLGSGEAEGSLRLAFEAIREAGPQIAHYKVGSIFESSPSIGNIGRAMEIGLEAFGGSVVPLVAGAPDLGLHCVFGNLFARDVAGSERYRLDRHPSASQQPATPMNEADLRHHLAAQTPLRIGLLDVLNLDRPADDRLSAYHDVCAAVGCGGVLIDLMSASQYASVGELLLAGGRQFVIGSAGVEAALCAAWTMRNRLSSSTAFDSIDDVGPIVVVSGSGTPVTCEQIAHATAAGYAEVILRPHSMDAGEINNALVGAVAAVTRSLKAGRSVVLHTQAQHQVEHVNVDGPRLGTTLGHVLRMSMQRHPIRRVVIAGGGTCGRVALALGINAVEMIAPFVCGAPLCRATSANKAVNGLEVVFKGGQSGPVDFFEQARNNRASEPANP